jgi:hypothetical protein
MATLTTTVRPATGDRLHTPIWWPLRAWLVAEVGFGLVAILSVFLFPQDTAVNFAWPIKPTVMAATLGAFYIAASLIFVLSLWAREWQQVRVMVLPSAAFTTVMLLATVLHWDKFLVGTRPFAVWLASYVLPPPIFGALYVLHQRRASPVGVGIEVPLPAWVRRVLVTNGLGLTAAAALFFAVPALLMRIGPWAFTPLTVRTLCGWLIATGLLQVSMGWEGDWRRARLGSAMLLLLPLALLFQMLRFATEVRWTNLALWVLLVDCVLVAALMFWLWLRAGTRTT